MKRPSATIYQRGITSVEYAFLVIAVILAVNFSISLIGKLTGGQIYYTGCRITLSAQAHVVEIEGGGSQTGFPGGGDEPPTENEQCYARTVVAGYKFTFREE